MVRYVNPFSTFGFCKLFGGVGNKELLVDFLNQMLPQTSAIGELQFVKSNPPKAFFQLSCVSTTGILFEVFINLEHVNFFKERALLYSTFPIRDQAEKGAQWDFQLNEVYFIAILDFEYDEDEERRKFIRHVQLKDQDGDLFYAKFHFKFLQMPLFKLKEHELVTHFDKWVYFLKNLGSFEQIPAILKEPIFEKAFQTAELAKMTHAQFEAYEKSQLDYLTMNAVVNSAMDRGVEKGIKIARAEAEAKERALVLRLHAKGMLPAEISELTGIDVEKVIAIIADVAN